MQYGKEFQRLRVANYLGPSREERSALDVVPGVAKGFGAIWVLTALLLLSVDLR